MLLVLYFDMIYFIYRRRELGVMLNLMAAAMNLTLSVRSNNLFGFLFWTDPNLQSSLSLCRMCVLGWRSVLTSDRFSSLPSLTDVGMSLTS